MIMFDKKRAMQTIMQKRGANGGPMTMAPSPMKPEIVKDEDGMPDGKHLAAQDMISAFHEKSADKLMQALSNFMDIHSVADSKEDPRDGEKV